MRGFERGCDDYLTKPFSYPELRGADRRAAAPRATPAAAAGACRSGRSRSTRWGARCGWTGEPIHLSKKEFALLRALAEEPTRVFTREELLRGVWGYRSLGHDPHA